MQWRTLFNVLRLYREAFLFEVGQTVGLITLRSHMKQVHPLLAVLHEEIASVVLEHPDQVDVAEEGGVVQRCLLTTTLCVDVCFCFNQRRHD